MIQLQGSQYVNSNSSSAASDPSASWPSLEKSDSEFGQLHYGGDYASTLGDFKFCAKIYCFIIQMELVWSIPRMDILFY